MSPRIIGVVCLFAALILDQGSKAIVLSTPALHSGIDLLPVVSLILVRNEGISFGLLSGLAPWWALTALGGIIVAALSVWLSRSHSTVLSVALGLIIGGAIGNIFDRVRHGAVTDFLDLHVASYHWPAFNLADVAVVCGVGILLLDSLRPDRTPDDATAGGDHLEQG